MEKKESGTEKMSLSRPVFLNWGDAEHQGAVI